MLRQMLVLVFFIGITRLSCSAIVVPNTKDFNTQISSMNTCYLNAKTSCNGVDMSSYYWSDDPKAYWEQVNQSLGSAPANTPLQQPAPLPVPVAMSAPTLPVQENTGILISHNNQPQNTSANSSGFIIG